MTASSAALASSSLPILSKANDINTLAQVRSGCFFSTFSASCRAFLLLPLSSQSIKMTIFYDIFLENILAWLFRQSRFRLKKEQFPVPLTPLGMLTIISVKKEKRI
jgi:hypothetical protein